MRQIAQALNMDRSFVARTLQLANLAPDIVKAIWGRTASRSASRWTNSDTASPTAGKNSVNSSLKNNRITALRISYNG